MEIELLRRADNLPFHLSTEINSGKGSKKYDLLLWNPNAIEPKSLVTDVKNARGRQNGNRYTEFKSQFSKPGVSIAKIELKQTGNYLTRKETFLEELKRYSADNDISDGECIYAFGCYYEDTPEYLTRILKEFGSLLKWAESTKHQSGPEFKITDNFRRNCLEFYAFRGSEPWVFIDNKDVYGL
jgi:hypothetical protein